MPKINKTKEMFLIVQLEIVDVFFLKLFGKKIVNIANHQTLLKSAKIGFTIWIQLISFWGMSCVYFCLFVSVLFASHCIFFTFVKSMIVLGFFGLFVMSSISCCVLCLFVLMYDIGIKYDMIWWYMIWYDMHLTANCPKKLKLKMALKNGIDIFNAIGIEILVGQVFWR